MPVPFVQYNPIQDTEDTRNLTPAGSVGQSYVGRGLSGINDSFIGEAYRGVQGYDLQHDGSEMMSKEDAENQYGNGGLTHFDAPVSRDYAKFQSAQDAIKNGIQDSMAKGGNNSASKTWLGFGLNQATSMLDPFQDGAAILSDGITKFSPIRPGFVLGPATTRLASRALSGVQTAATFSALTEPVHAAIDDNWNLQDAAKRVGAGMLFLGLTHGLFGQTPLKYYADDSDIPSPQDSATQNLLEDHLQPQTKASMGEAAVARAQAGKPMEPLNDLVGLDPRIMEHEAKLGGVQLPFEERAQILASMDDGTYKDPLAEPKVTLDNEGNELSQSEQDEIQQELADTNKVTLPPRSGQGGFINLLPIVQALATKRVVSLTDKLNEEATSQPQPLSIGRNPDADLTTEEKVTTLLQPYERPITPSKESGSPAVQTGSPSGAVGRAGSKPQIKKSGGGGRLLGVGTDGASIVAGGGRVLFKNSKTNRHGAISYVQGNDKPFVVTAANKRTFTPDTLHQFGTYAEAEEWVNAGFDKQYRKRPYDNSVDAFKPSGKFTVSQNEVPHISTPDIRLSEGAQLLRSHAAHVLDKDELQTWSKDGGWYPHGLQHKRLGTITHFDNPEEWNKLPARAKEMGEKYIKMFQNFHDKLMFGDAIQNDKTGIALQPHQLPRQLEKMEGLRVFLLHHKDPSVITDSFTRDTSVEGHIAVSILRDKEGNPYLAVHEAQAGYSKFPQEEAIAHLAFEVRKFAQENDLPVVLPSSDTAQHIYKREGRVSSTFTRAYNSKSGYVTRGFKKAFGESIRTPVKLEDMWNPLGEEKVPYKGMTIESKDPISTAKDIIKEEDAKEPAYNQAIQCVKGTV